MQGAEIHCPDKSAMVARRNVRATGEPVSVPAAGHVTEQGEWSEQGGQGSDSLALDEVVHLVNPSFFDVVWCGSVRDESGSSLHGRPRHALNCTA